MYLSRLTLNRSRAAFQWLSNLYHIHQRLMMACDNDPRLLFRIEDTNGITRILVQSHVEPQWETAFADLPVLLGAPETKLFDVQLQVGRSYRFRLLANPTVKKTAPKDGNEKHKFRIGLHREEDQRAWIERKLVAVGAELSDCLIVPRGSQHSRKGVKNDEGQQTHLAVLFEGVLKANDPALLQQALQTGIGSAKGFGFGLLSLASFQ
jgi:CRISPR system Cascade subunit CasE